MSTDRSETGGLDTFRGGESLRRLSTRLMDWYQDEVSDEDVVLALGEAALAPFRFAQARLRGRVRRVTLEPAFCHSADVALRARELGYDDHTVAVCLLHDVVEDSAGGIDEALALFDEIAARFTETVARDVRLLTNRHAIVFEAIAPKVRRDLPFEARSVRAYRAALEVLRHELPPATEARCQHELSGLARFLEERAELGTWARIAARDRKFCVATALERQIYHLYAEELVGSVADRLSGSWPGEPDSALVVKFVDLTDNVRTTELSGRLPMYKLIHKAEAVLDAARARIVDPGLLVGHEAHTTLPEWVPLLACRLADQLHARRAAVAAYFAETRFSGLVDFLGAQFERLGAKYDVPADRLECLQRLEDAVRRKNAR
jgi:hypothetical protein